MPDKIEKDHWHPGFLGAMEIEFRAYRPNLIFDDEHSLSKEPLKMDLLIIKKGRGCGELLADGAGIYTTGRPA